MEHPLLGELGPNSTVAVVKELWDANSDIPGLPSGPISEDDHLLVEAYEHGRRCGPQHLPQLSPFKPELEDTYRRYPKEARRHQPARASGSLALNGSMGRRAHTPRRPAAVPSTSDTSSQALPEVEQSKKSIKPSGLIGAGSMQARPWAAPARRPSLQNNQDELMPPLLLAPERPRLRDRILGLFKKKTSHAVLQAIVEPAFASGVQTAHNATQNQPRPANHATASPNRGGWQRNESAERSARRRLLQLCGITAPAGAKEAWAPSSGPQLKEAARPIQTEHQAVPKSGMSTVVLTKHPSFEANLSRPHRNISNLGFAGVPLEEERRILDGLRLSPEEPDPEPNHLNALRLPRSPKVVTEAHERAMHAFLAEYAGTGAGDQRNIQAPRSTPQDALNLDIPAPQVEAGGTPIYKQLERKQKAERLTQYWAGQQAYYQSRERARLRNLSEQTMPAHGAY